MTESLFSPSWYRVADLTPKLRSHAQIHRHQYRGQTWFVLQDHSAGRFHRFSPSAYFVIGLMDGRRTTQVIWQLAAERLGDEAPTQEEMIKLLSQLYMADALQCDVPPDTAEVLRRAQRQEKRAWMGRFLNPLALRFPLLDPERVLQRFLPLVRPLMGWTGGVLWLAVVGPAIVLVGTHWTDLTENLLDRVLEPQNLLLLWLLFPILKVFHEFGHAFTAKAFGGEVHEMGVMFLVFAPVPYVDASSASAFRSKWQRILVGAAGMVVELFLAALALYLWLSVEPGLVRTLAYNAVLIGSISTVGFNANPLLRFDGYYILADWLEIPNLRQRSNAYLGYLCERYLFGEPDTPMPPATAGERGWFVTYAVASFVYRTLVIVAILFFLMDEWFVVGILLSGFATIMWFVVPTVKGLSYLFTNPRIRKVRGRAIAVTGTALAGVLAALCLLPVPWRTQAEGVVWIPEESFVRAGTEGVIERVVTRPGSRVKAGAPLLVATDPELATQIKVWEFRIRELRAKWAKERTEDLVKAMMTAEELVYATESLAQARKRTADLVIRSQTAGTFVAPRAPDLPGRFVRQGELLAHVVDLQTITVRAVVPQTEVDLILRQTRRVDVRLAEQFALTAPAVLTRIVPTAEDQVPSRALSSEGGGQIPLDPKDQKGRKTLQRVFQVDLELTAPGGFVNAGGRVYVRFDHGTAPLATQWYRQLRQLFLSRFTV